MDIRKVKKLIELLEESGMAEIEIHEGEESVRISRGQAPLIQSPTPLPAVVQPISQAVEERAIEEEKPPVDGKQITSPMVGLQKQIVARVCFAAKYSSDHPEE